jgi:hypothetical protein
LEGDQHVAAVLKLPCQAAAGCALQVKTSDMKGAGTDANIDVELRGSNGGSGWKRLLANYDTFERGQVRPCCRC